MSPSERAVQKKEVPPRERILAAACELFYSRGIRSVSVDEIAAAAQTNKMTLYRHFDSKDQLVAEYLRSLSRCWNAMADEAERGHPGDPDGQLHAWIEEMGRNLCKAQDRGCPMANAAVELPEKDHPARAVIQGYKTEQRERLARLCRAAGYANPEALADEIFLLFEGACVNIQSVGQRGPAPRFTEMALGLLKSRGRQEQKPG